MNLFHCLFFAIFVHSATIIGAKDEYTEKDLIAIQKLRDRMGDALYREYMKSDPYLIRWLRATNFDLGKATEKLTRTLKWRKDNNIDNILNETVWDFNTPVYYEAGQDSYGGLVTVFRLKPIELRNHLLNQRQQIAIRFWQQLLESIEIRIMSALGVLGNSSTEGALLKGIGIWDVAGYSVRQHGCFSCIPVYVQMITDYVEYYPGYARSLIVINVPRVATPLAELLRPILERQLDGGGFELFDLERAKWMKHIFQFVRPEKLGPHLGGMRNVTNEEEREFLRKLYNISQSAIKN